MQSKGLWLGHLCASNILHTAECSVTLYASSSELFIASKSWECFLKALGETSILLWQRNTVKINVAQKSVYRCQTNRGPKLQRKQVWAPAREKLSWFSGGEMWEIPKNCTNEEVKAKHTGGKGSANSTCVSLDFFLASLFLFLQLFFGTWWIAHLGWGHKVGSADLCRKMQTQVMIVGPGYRGDTRTMLCSGWNQGCS